jgi:hypothetical protein
MELVHSCLVGSHDEYFLCNTDANNLSGELPEELCCLPCLETLSMAENKLTGQIPQCMGTMGAVLNLENNQFSLPEENTAELSKWP